MAGGKQTPRQKMINLMYLVFIAMMAMQVDRQVLRSFEDITITLNDSSNLTNENNVTFYEQIDLKAADDPDYAAIQAQANEVKAQANQAFQLIETIKNEISASVSKEGYTLPVGRDEEEESNYNSLSNTDAMTKYLFAKQNEPTEKGAQLQKAIEDYREFLIKAYGSSERDIRRINSLFSTENKKGKKTWLNTKFYDQPMIAGLANLTKIQSDIRTEEGGLVRALLANKLQDEIELKAFEPIVMVPPFVRNDKPAEASIAFGAFDNTLQGKVEIEGIGEVPLTNGKANFTLNTASTGVQEIKGVMTYKGADGKDIEIPFSQEYEVISETLVSPPSGAVITADKMNVVYRGLDNPITATVNGADGPVTLTANVGGLSGSNGKYIFKPAAGSNTVTFTASATTSTGKVVTDKKEFRIKPVPPARGNILGKTSITVPANGIAAQTVRVDWPDFLFELTAEVESFKVKVPGQPTASVTGNKLSGAAGVLSKARRGDAVFVFDIKYKSGAISGEASPITIEVQ